MSLQFIQMKKYLFLCSIMFAFALAISPTIKTEAQTLQINLVSTNNSLTRDTVTNTGAILLVAPVRGRTEQVGIQVTCTKISGTVAGTIIPVASNDGVNFYAAGAGTFTATDVASQGILFAPPLGYAYYGVRWTGAGTMSASLIAKLVAK